MKRIFLASAVALTLPWQTFATDLPPPSRELEMVYRVVWGEARSLPAREITAICHIIKNRAEKLKGKHRLYRVVTRANQFSALNHDDPNRRPLLASNLPTTKGYRRVARACAQALHRDKTMAYDETRGADHYFHGKKIPYWADGQTIVKIGQTNVVKVVNVKRKKRPKTDEEILDALITRLSNEAQERIRNDKPIRQYMSALEPENGEWGTLPARGDVPAS